MKRSCKQEALFDARAQAGRALAGFFNNSGERALKAMWKIAFVLASIPSRVLGRFRGITGVTSLLSDVFLGPDTALNSHYPKWRVTI
jgi:hypothetical protein